MTADFLRTERPPSIVYVVDDDLSMREALEELIASEGLRVVCFDSARALLEFRVTDQPSCAVVDVRMPGLSGFDLQRELAGSGRAIPIVFITAHADVPMAVRAMKAGAVEFLPKPFRSEDLLFAIRNALERDRLELARRAELVRLRQRRNHLTRRQHEVLVRIGRGLRNKQIAAEFGVSENTIKAHRNRIMKKMGAATFADLVRMIAHIDSSSDHPG